MAISGPHIPLDCRHFFMCSCFISRLFCIFHPKVFANYPIPSPSPVVKVRQMTQKRWKEALCHEHIFLIPKWMGGPTISHCYVRIKILNFNHTVIHITQVTKQKSWVEPYFPSQTTPIRSCVGAVWAGRILTSKQLNFLSP